VCESYVDGVRVILREEVQGDGKDAGGCVSGQARSFNTGLCAPPHHSSEAWDETASGSGTMQEQGRTGTLEAGAARLRAAAARRATGTATAEGAGAWYILHQRTSSSWPLDCLIKNGLGEEILRITSAPRDTLVFQDRTGLELYRTAPPDGSPATMDILRPDGSVAATVHNAIFSPVRDRWQIDVPGGESMVAAGSLLQHEYALRRGGDTIAVVSKTWVPRRDTYGVMVDDAADLPLVLAVAVVLDLLAHRASTGRPGDPGNP
jgi:uncharacterized protein YxjI